MLRYLISNNENMSLFDRMMEKNVKRAQSMQDGMLDRTVSRAKSMQKKCSTCKRKSTRDYS